VHSIYKSKKKLNSNELITNKYYTFDSLTYTLGTQVNVFQFLIDVIIYIFLGNVIISKKVCICIIYLFQNYIIVMDT